MGEVMSPDSVTFGVKPLRMALVFWKPGVDFRVTPNPGIFPRISEFE